jgi:hypothetical protein
MVPASKQIQAFFFKAMLLRAKEHGSTHKKGNGFVMLPLYSGFQFRDGNFRLVEVIREIDRDNSQHRVIKIFFKRKEVWIMQCVGWYSMSALSLLERAQVQNYEQGIFLNLNIAPQTGLELIEIEDVFTELPSGFSNFFLKKRVVYIPDGKRNQSIHRMPAYYISTGGLVN